MMYLPRQTKFIKVFIAYAHEDEDEALAYFTLLNEEDFDPFKYQNLIRGGANWRRIVSVEIDRSHVFLPVIDENSAHASSFVPHEFGLATSLRSGRGGHPPLIIPVYSENGAWRKLRGGERPHTFPIRDFETGGALPDFDLQSVVWFDESEHPTADLIDWLTPLIVVSREDSFISQDEFYDSGAFDLYQSLFPENEQDSPTDIIDWVLHYDIGCTREKIMDDVRFCYTLDSRFFILKVENIAIGISFITYDSTTKLIYGNYIAVKEHWRSGHMARAFGEGIWKICKKLFSEIDGTVFEVETFDITIAEKEVEFFETLKTHKDRAAAMNVDGSTKHLRRIFRVYSYQMEDCVFFMDSEQNFPLVAVAPCLDPTIDPGQWEDEEEYWIMWSIKYQSEDAKMQKANDLWVKSIKCIYEEVLIKSLADRYTSKVYWHYGRKIVERNVGQVRGRNVALRPYRVRKMHELLHRWNRLGLPMAI